MAHPDVFLRIPDKSDAESRMMAVMEWYLTSFHASRKVKLKAKLIEYVVKKSKQKIEKKSLW